MKSGACKKPAMFNTIHVTGALQSLHVVGLPNDTNNNISAKEFIISKSNGTTSRLFDFNSKTPILVDKTEEDVWTCWYDDIEQLIFTWAFLSNTDYWTFEN